MNNHYRIKKSPVNNRGFLMNINHYVMYIAYNLYSVYGVLSVYTTQYIHSIPKNAKKSRWCLI